MPPIIRILTEFRGRAVWQKVVCAGVIAANTIPSASNLRAISSKYYFLMTSARNGDMIPWCEIFRLNNRPRPINQALLIRFHYSTCISLLQTLAADKQLTP